MKKDLADKVRQTAVAFVTKVVQEGTHAIMSDETNPYALPSATHLGCDAALCSLIPIVPFLAKRPHLDKSELKEKGAKELIKLITPETVLFAALIAAKMHQGIKVDDIVELDLGTAAECSAQSSFGPDILAEALDDWKKLTGKKPEDYFHESILSAIDSAVRDSSVPFDEFLKNRQSAPSSKTLQ